MAEGGGFEPPEGVNLQRFSRPPQSAALPSLRRPISWRHENGGASGTRTHVAAVQRRSSPAELWPREKSRAASPMPTAPRQGNLRKPAGNFEAASPVPTAPATMAALLFGFRTNQTVAAPVPATTGGYFQNGKHHVLWSLPVRGGSFSLHPRRPSLRGGVKSEIILIFVSRRPSTRFRRVCSGLRQRLGSYLAPLPVRPSSRLFSKSRGSRWAFPLSLKTV